MLALGRLVYSCGWGVGVQSPAAANRKDALAWIESMSTENTRAPSFASNAARGRPTTSDLQWVYRCPSLSFFSNSLPIDNGDHPSVGPITVRQDPVIHPGVLEAFHDRERRTWEDGFDRPRWRLIVDSHGNLLRRRDFWLRQERRGFNVSNTVFEGEVFRICGRSWGEGRRTYGISYSGRRSGGLRRLLEARRLVEGSGPAVSKVNTRVV